MRHGAKVKTCRYEGCTNLPQNGGVCMRHGATMKGVQVMIKRVEFVIGTVPNETLAKIRDALTKSFKEELRVMVQR